MPHCLIDKDGNIVNVILVDEITASSGWQPPEGLRHVFIEDAGIGWAWDGAKATNPHPEPIGGKPRVIS